MVATNNLGIPKVEQSQSQKEVTVNEALAKIDAILNVGALDKDLAIPPVSPTEGDLYIVAAAATGAWVGRDGDIAYYESTAWKFIDPAEGFTIWVNDEDTHYSFDGTAWGSRTDNITSLGVNTTSDATNKLAVASAAILFSNIGNGVQVKVNKNAAGDSGGFLFQTSWSGRAEFGCLGNDDFTLKVSPDGSTYYESWVIDKDSGDCAFKANISLPDGVTAPATVTGQTFIYVDSADGDLKVKFGDGTIKTLATDT